MRSPYEGLPPEAFWRTGVVGQSPEAIRGLYRKKFPITRRAKIATAGSCFAQHIARHLRARRFSLVDAEPAPRGLDEQSAAEFGYGLYSARYANIYTARQLRQIVEEACGSFRPADPVWEKDGRFYDAMRPSVEPTGLSSPGAVLDHRDYHLQQVLKVIRSADIFIFTLGLTEAWVHGPSATVYPTAPGTIAGCYDPAVHRFHNFGFAEIHDDLSRFFELAMKENPKIRFLLTVSPVPLVATASGEHVLSATTYSKSVLRAAAGQLFHERENVDYFPSYEIITSALSQAKFFEENLRSVRAAGVAAAMDAFFSEHDDHSPGARELEARSPRESEDKRSASADEDVVCEEILLDAFSQ
jgi:GSCFA family protein